MRGIIFDWMGTLYEKGRGLFPFTERVLRELKPRYKLGLVSIARDGIEVRKRQLQESGIIHLFDSVIVDTSKTDAHYLRCMEEMGITPADTAIVDDRTVRGISVGNRLGCTTFWIQVGEYGRELPNSETGEPAFKINSVEDLIGLL